MYLMVAGGIITTLNLLSLIASLTPCDRDDKIVAGLSPLVAIAMFAVSIWGAVVVFGKLNEYLTLLKKSIKKILFLEIFFLGPYSKWTYEDSDRSSDNYCEYTPFMFAFVMLILQWLMIPILVGLACCLGCAALAA